jgi:hypothetical protein
MKERRDAIFVDVVNFSSMGKSNFQALLVALGIGYTIEDNSCININMQSKLCMHVCAMLRK